MTVSTTQTKVIYQGDGRTRQWAYTFPIMKEDHIAVYVTNLEGQTHRVQSDYQVDSMEKVVIYPVLGDSLESGTKIALMRKTPLTQDLDLVNNGGFFPENVEKSFDRGVFVEQELLEQLERSVKMPETSNDNRDFAYEIIEARNRAEKAAGEAESSQQQAETHANKSEQEARKSELEADRAQSEATKARQAADEALVGGIRSINGKDGNEVILNSEDVGAAEKNHSHHFLDKLPELTDSDKNKVLFVGDNRDQIEWRTIGGVPVGTIIAWGGLTPPPGYLECSGQILKREIYKDLFKAIGTVWGTTAVDNFKLPNFTSAARFLRSRGDGLEVGEMQEDAIRNITGRFGHTMYEVKPEGVFVRDGATGTGFAQGSPWAGNYPIKMDASLQVPTANENRPKSAVIMYCIKAVDEYINPDQVDMAKVDQQKANREDVKELAGTRLWVSDEYQPVMNAPTIVEHGLNIDPLKCKWEVLLKCVSPEFGYEIGDIAIGGITIAQDNSLYWAMSLTPSMGNKTIQFNTSAFLSAINKAKGTRDTLTLLKWRYIFRIWY